MLTIKMISVLLVLMVTIGSGFYPFFYKRRSEQGLEFPAGESLAAGIFLGAGLMHMLADASFQFHQHSISYPLAPLLAGVTFLLLLLLEHIGRELYQKQGDYSKAFAILAVIMLSIHSFLAGAALGLSANISIVIMILLAILAHKWAAGFALAVHINKSSLSFKSGIALFAVFAMMVPLGIIWGDSAARTLSGMPLIEPAFSSMAAGTFLYLGTLHGLERAAMIKQCCDLKRFLFLIAGFAIMSLVALWT